MHTALLSFNAGEVSPYLRHRIDFDKSQSAAETMANFIAMPYGGVIKRPGLRYLTQVAAGGDNSKFVPFIASTGERYLLHFTPGNLKIYSPEGILKSTLAFMTSITWPSPTVWESNLRAVQCVQVNDVAFITHPLTHPLKLSRFSDTSWNLAYVDFTAPPMLDENTDTGINYSVGSNPIAAAWASATTYSQGNEVFTNSQWECIAGHTSDSSNLPGLGSAWRSYWKRKIFQANDPITLIADNQAGTGWTLLNHSYHAGDIYLQTGTGTIGIALYDHSSTTAMSPADSPTSSAWGLIREWQVDYDAYSTIAVGAYRIRLSDLTVYRCILAHTPHSIGYSSEPGVGAAWHTYWEDSTIDLPGTIPTWFLSDAYSVGAQVIVSGKKYRCISSHTPVAATNKPATGSSWGTYWARVDSFLPSPTSITATGPGRAMRLAPERTAGDLQVEITADNGAISPPIFVAGAWDFFTYGTWSGTFTIERSTDNGSTWQTARYYQTSADRNIADQGEESPASLLRIRYDGTTSAAEGVLIPRRADVPGYIMLTQYVSDTRMYGHAITPIMSGTTYRWTPGAFDDLQGFPKAIAMHESRLVFGGTASRPVSLWLSQSDDFTNFEVGTDATDAIFATLAISNASPIRWIASQRRLFIGTLLGEWVAGSETQDAPLAPSNFAARQYSACGSAAITPLVAADAVFFAERKGTRLRELGYSSASESYEAADLSRLAEHITRPGIIAMAWQQTREPGLWVILRDGTALHFSYNRAEKIAAWSRHNTQGGLIRDVAVLPSDLGDDEVFFIISRGASTTMERMPQHWQASQESDIGWFNLDGISGTGSGGTVTLPAHLLNTPVLRLNPSTLELSQQTYTANPTISNGEPYQIGLPITSLLDSIPIETQTQEGTTQARKKRIHKVILSLYNSRGGHLYNADATRKQPIANTKPQSTLRTGWEDTTPDAGTLDDIQLRLIHSDPFPFCLRSAVIRWQVNEP